MNFKTEEGDLNQALEVLAQLPEFTDLKARTYYENRLENKQHLILLATVDNKAVACKVGFDRFADGSFYSWLGGVHPSFRNQGIAKALAGEQQAWAKKHGFRTIRFKTLNRHKAMLAFSILNGFEILNVKAKDELENYRIELVKKLR